MKALKLAIKKRLTDDSNYITLMGSPATEPFQTYWFKPPVQPTFPETVLNLQTGINNSSMGPEIVQGVWVLSINVWSKDDAYEDIIKRIIYLLNQKPDTVTTGFRAILSRDGEDLIDDEFNVYGKNVMFDVHYGRAII
jgi:hypothetical protein